VALGAAGWVVLADEATVLGGALEVAAGEPPASLAELMTACSERSLACATIALAGGGAMRALEPERHTLASTHVWPSLQVLAPLHGPE
jgi:hypothetical protein